MSIDHDTKTMIEVAALRQSEQAFKTLVENLPDIVLRMDRSLQYLYANPALEQQLGVAPGYLVGKSAHDLAIEPTTVGAFDARLQEVFQTGQPHTLQLALPAHDGSLRQYRVRIVPEFDQRPTVVTVLVIATDMTDLFHAQADLERRNVQLEAAADLARRHDELRSADLALAQAARLKDEFMASMSHELRTPLTGVLGLAEALQAQTYGPLNERQLRSLRLIEQSGRHLLDLINDILDLSKIEAGQLELTKVACAAEDVCHASLQIVAGLAQEKGHAVHFAIEPVAIDLMADPRRLNQMLVNLLSNAVKFTPPGGSLGLQVDGDEAACDVRFAVWDTGIGIAPEDVPLLFRPFTQLDSSLTRRHAGSGLGLVLTRRMAELHGGRVEVESAPASGSRFTIILPWVPPAPADGAPEASPAPVWLTPTATANPLAANPLLLLVEDNPTNADAFGGYLQGQGYHVILATDGASAIQEALQQHPALILMDIQMPRMDGLSAIRQLRLYPETVRTPIIAVTALAMPGDRERCMEAGADAYVSKPFGLRQLRNLIEHHLGNG